MVRIRYLGIIIFPALCACTIKPPEVHITSEKTALENQMFGEKARISDELSTSIAVWASLEKYSWETGGQKELSEYRDEYKKRRLTLAQIRRKTMSEYINEFKRQGILGEAYDGRIAVMADSLKEENMIAGVVRAENQDREIILSFFFESRGMEDETDKSGARAEFARVMARISPDGTWIQDYEGNWAVK
jgi:uncharacterized protein YdbL (DUF1318 family)